MIINRAVLLIIFLFFFLAKPDNLPECAGKFKYKQPNKVELEEILRTHKEWLSTFSRAGDPINKELLSDSRKANLCQALLYEIDFSKADLTMANLFMAQLQGANLCKALFSLTNLSRSNLEGANLSETILSGVNLSMGILNNANLTGVKLYRTNLSEARMENAIMKRAVFEPDSLPNADDIAYAKNLSEMVYIHSPQALVKLRALFKNAGYRDQEREITYAIEHQRTIDLLNGKDGARNRFQGLFRIIAFDLTTKWGMDPDQALWILMFCIIIYTVPYYKALSKPTGPDGIWRKWNQKSIHSDLEKDGPELLETNKLKALRLAFYFSLLSGISIGWREANVRNWIQRLQTKDYTLHATGWVRAVAGTQSLIGLYLIVLWALTCFVNLFE